MVVCLVSYSGASSPLPARSAGFSARFKINTHPPPRHQDPQDFNNASFPPILLTLKNSASFKILPSPSTSFYTPFLFLVLTQHVLWVYYLLCWWFPHFLECSCLFFYIFFSFLWIFSFCVFLISLCCILFSCFSCLLCVCVRVVRGGDDEIHVTGRLPESKLMELGGREWHAF